VIEAARGLTIKQNLRDTKKHRIFYLILFHLIPLIRAATMSSRQSFISTYLDSPIIRNDRDRFLQTILEIRAGEKSKSHPSVIRKARGILDLIKDADLLPLEPDYYPSFNSILDPSDHFGEVREAYRLGSIVFNQASAGARDWGISEGLGVTMADPAALPGWAIKWYNNHRMFRKVIDKIACSNALGNPGMIQAREGNVYFHFDSYYGVIKIDEVEDWYLLTYDQLLMFKDMYYGRFNASYACLQIYRSQELLASVQKCLGWFFKCLGIHGNKGYELGKNIEPLAKANLIRIADPILGLDGSYESMLEMVRAKERKFGTHINYLADELDLILREERPASHAVELFGLQKLSGHPLIDPSIGGRSVIAEARSKIAYKQTDVSRLRNNFCRMYTEGYIRSHGRWPKLEFCPEARHTKLYQLYSLQELKISVDSYSLSDWEGVRFDKHLDFDYYPNFTDLMDDKAISYYRDQAAATWDTKIKTRSHKRLLIEMLQRPEISVREIVERVRVGDIPYSWTIVSLYPKEREFKLEARMFSMMVFEMRAFFTAAEANLADHVFPNLPQQTMTLSKQEIQELFHKVTHTVSDEDLVRLYLEVDLTRWNLRWHPEVIDPIGRDLEDMFGLPGVYTVVHHFFRSCMILVRVFACKPDGIDEAVPPETSLVWYDHEVGFEGIAQKLWTCATYTMIDLGIASSMRRYYLIGQADNQIILTSVDCTTAVDRRHKVKETADMCALSIEHECRKVGQEAKQEECLQSTEVVTYSKDVYIGGVEFFTSIKASSRMFPHSASDFPSVENAIGALSGQAIAASERMKQPMNGFALWCLHTALYLGHLTTLSPVESLYLSAAFRDSLTTRDKIGLMILPGDLGGCPIAPVTSFFYKGGADPLSKSYASLKFYQKRSPLARKLIGGLHSERWYQSPPDRAQLLDDPYGLPLKRPATAESAIQRESKDKVQGMTANRALKGVTSAKIDHYEKSLSCLLLQCTPFNPVLLSDIMGWSIVGARKAVTKMFTSTRTVQALLQDDETINPCSKILSSGTGHFLNSLERIRGAASGERRIESIYSDVSDLRQRWNTAGDPPLAGVTAYVPFDLPLEVSRSAPIRSGFKMYFDCPSGKDPFHTRGASDPYIGRSTVEKRADHGYKITVSSAPERAVKRLADIATQPGVGESFKYLVSRVAESRADANLDDVYAQIGYAIGGKIAHRYSSRYGLRAASGLGSMSFASHCYLSNDSADPISGGERDIQIMVQEEMVCGIAVGQIMATSVRQEIFTTLCTDKTDWVFLPDDILEGPDQVILPPVRIPDNIIATAEFIELKRTHGPRMSPLSPPLIEVSTVGDPHKLALRRLISRALKRSRSALAIADRGAGMIHFKIDILELRGCGIIEVLTEMSKEVACLAIEAMFARSSGEMRWTPVPLIVSLSDALARSIAVMLIHPFFREDPFVARYIYPSPLSYDFSGSNSIAKVKTTISRLALEHFSMVTSPIFTSPEVVFADDHPESVSMLVIRRVKLILYQSMIMGECPTLHAYKIARRTVPSTIRAEISEDHKLQALYRMVVGLAVWARTQEYQFLTEHFTSLYTGRAIMTSDVTASELFREVRQNRADRMISEGIQSRAEGLTSFTRLGRPEFRVLENTAPLVELNQDTEFSTDQYDLFSFRRLVGRLYGADSSAGYSYLPLVPVARDRVCVVIGCGFGSGAAVMLKFGASHVYGLDLWKDYSPVNAMSGSNMPPAVVAAGLLWGFTRITVSPDHPGDIRSSGTAQLINAYARTGRLVIVDIPALRREDICSTLATLSLLDGVPEVLWRYIGSRKNADIIMTMLMQLDGEMAVEYVYAEDSWVECWWYFRVPRLVHAHSTLILRPSSPVIRTESELDLSFLGGGNEYLYGALAGPYGALSMSQIEGSLLNFTDLLSASIGDLDHRFTYKQWTDILHAYIAKNVLFSDDPEGEIRQIIAREAVPVTISGHDLLVNVSTRLKRLLTRVVPRLLTRVQ